MNKNDIIGFSIIGIIGLPLMAGLFIYGIPAFCRFTIWIGQLTGQIPM